MKKFLKPTPVDNSVDLLTTNDKVEATGGFAATDVYFGTPPESQKGSGIEQTGRGDEPKKEGDPDDFFFMFDMPVPKLLNNTTIYFPCYVDQMTADMAIGLIKQVNRNISTIELEYPELKGKIEPKFIINSGGGNVVQGLRLFDAIKNNMYPITTIANGIAASMGIIILTAGKKVQATEHSTLMIHQISAGHQGKYFELKGHMEYWDQLQSQLAQILVNNTKAKKEDIEKFMAGETYILAPEALKLGIIQEIVSV